MGKVFGTNDILNMVFDNSANSLNFKLVITDIQPAIAAVPAHYERSIPWAKASANTLLQSPDRLTVNIGDSGYILPSQIDLNLAAATSWDTVAGTDYTVAANRAGKDFYIYACQPSAGNVPKFVLSANSTVPAGYTADNSRKIGGFHCLCVDAGDIPGHPLSGFLAGDILPASIWDLKHRPVSSPEGMVYSEAANIWVDIYLQSGTGASTASVYGATITDTRNWMDFVDDGGAVRKQLLTDFEFQLIAAGSNEMTNIAGSAHPGTTGGHVDTKGRRMISNIGCEDCCGAMYQWLNEQSYRYDGGSHTHSENAAESYTQNAETGATDPVPSWAWHDLPGAKGSIYKQGSYGDVKLLAGAAWAHGSASGSRARYAYGCRWFAYSNYGCRLRSEPLKS